LLRVAPKITPNLASGPHSETIAGLSQLPSHPGSTVPMHTSLSVVQSESYSLINMQGVMIFTVLLAMPFRYINLRSLVLCSRNVPLITRSEIKLWR
jgi:hypothetical protein